MAADGTDLRALRERLADDFKHKPLETRPGPLSKPVERNLFPGAFGDPEEH